MYTYPTLTVSKHHREGKPQRDLTQPNFLRCLQRHQVCFEEQKEIVWQCDYPKDCWQGLGNTRPEGK